MKNKKSSPAFSEELSQWLSLMESRFAQFILPVTPAIAKLWGRLCVQTGNKGIDNLIAATALAHNLTVVTRNVKDFEAAGARVLNPFVAETARRPFEGSFDVKEIGSGPGTNTTVVELLGSKLFSLDHGKAQR